MDLFDDLPPPPEAAHMLIAPGAVLLRGFAREGDGETNHLEKNSKSKKNKRFLLHYRLLKKRRQIFGYRKKET